MEWSYFTRRATRSCPEGNTLTVDLSAYSYDDVGLVCWDITALVEALWSHRKTLQVWSQLQKDRRLWEACCDQLGIDWLANYHPSKRQCQGESGPEPSRFTRSCQTVSTTLLIVILLGWIVWSKLQKTRSRAHTIAQLFMDHFASGASIDAGDFQRMIREARHECGDENADCPHLPLARLEAQLAIETPQLRWLGVCSTLFGLIGNCAAARTILKELIGQMADRVMGGLSSMSATNPQKLDIKRRKSGKAAPAEDTYRIHHLRCLMKSRKSKNGKAAMKLDGYHDSVHMRWVDKDCAAYAVALAREFNQATGVLAVFEDAARLGNPARELFVYLTWSCSLRKGGAMPPQALGVVTHPRSLPTAPPMQSEHQDRFSRVSSSHQCFVRVLANLEI